MRGLRTNRFRSQIGWNRELASSQKGGLFLFAFIRGDEVPTLEKIRVTLPDGTVKECAQGTSPLDVAKEIGSRLAKAAVAAKVDGRVTDLTRPLNEDAELQILTVDSEEGLEVLRHSTAHLMAQALRRIHPETKLAIGPVVGERFYYDVDCPKMLSADDFEAIEKEMTRIASENLPIEREEIPKAKAEELFKQDDEVYKLEILEDLEDGSISLYRQGEFVDLCRGPHVPRTGHIKSFKLLSVAGAYWRGDNDRPMLQRIYGTSFPKKSDLDAYVTRLEEAARRDHRKLGPALDLYSFHELAPGFAFWHAKGQKLYRTLEDFSRELQEVRGYQEVATPWIMRSKLWEQSGHWYHYRDNMFTMESEGETLAVKPMNCPNHCLLYKEETRSYRDLPLRLAEYGPLSRFELSGTLHGLMRVRGFHQDDAHLFVREDQIESEITNVLEIFDALYQTLGMEYNIKLSTRPDDFMGTIESWEKAEAALARALESVNRDYEVNPGDGAFYGPKLDFYVTDALQRTWQCATLQLDYQFPEQFDLTYVDRDGEHKRPVMIHRAIMGSLERFIGILVEHFAGAFPTWLAPVQARVIPIGTDHVDYSRAVENALRAAGIRVEVDARSEKVGYKIRDAQVQKVPYMLVVGAKEVENGTVSVRSRSDGDLGAMALDAFTDKIKTEIRQKSL